MLQHDGPMTMLEWCWRRPSRELGMRCSSFLYALPPCTGVVSEEALWKVRTFNITDQWDHASLSLWQLDTPVRWRPYWSQNSHPDQQQKGARLRWHWRPSEEPGRLPPPCSALQCLSGVVSEVWIKGRVSEHNIKIVQFSIKKHSSYQEPGRFQMNEKRQSVDPTTGMTETLKLCDKDFKATRQKAFQ